MSYPEKFPKAGSISAAACATGNNSQNVSHSASKKSTESLLHPAVELWYDNGRVTTAFENGKSLRRGLNQRDSRSKSEYRYELSEPSSRAALSRRQCHAGQQRTISSRKKSICRKRETRRGCVRCDGGGGRDPYRAVHSLRALYGDYGKSPGADLLSRRSDRKRSRL